MAHLWILVVLYGGCATNAQTSATPSVAAENSRALAIRKRQEAIERLEFVIENAPDPDTKAELQARLDELKALEP